MLLAFMPEFAAFAFETGVEATLVFEFAFDIARLAVNVSPITELTI